MKINFIKLIVSLVVCQLAGIIGSLFTFTSIGSWYNTIIKPSFNPPNWIFGPVWTTLFVMMGVSLYLIWNSNATNPELKVALIVFGVQLFLNTTWSILFFGLNSPLLAFINIILLWIAILFTIIKFYNISMIGALLLIPYLLWVSFASILNFAIYWLNK